MNYYTTHTRIFLHAVVLGRMPISYDIYNFIYSYLYAFDYYNKAHSKAGRQGTARTPLMYAHNDNVHVPVCCCVIWVNIKPDQTRP